MKLFILLFFISSTVSGQSLVDEVNLYYNSTTKYTTDLEQWGKTDYWMSPKEFNQRKAGDCEDYAIAKYFKLKELGVTADLMRISHVSMNNKPHAVLIVYSRTQSPVVLDNITNEIITVKERTDLKVIYSFNEDHLWVNGNYVSSSDVISEWVELKART